MMKTNLEFQIIKTQKKQKDWKEKKRLRKKKCTTLLMKLSLTSGPRDLVDEKVDVLV